MANTDSTGAREAELASALGALIQVAHSSMDRGYVCLNALDGRDGVSVVDSVHSVLDEATADLCEAIRIARDVLGDGGECREPPKSEPVAGAVAQEPISGALEKQRFAIFRVMAIVRCLGQAFPTDIGDADVDVRELCNMAYDMLNDIAGEIDPRWLSRTADRTRLAA